MKAMNAKGVTSGPEATTNRQFNNGNKNMSTDLDLECIYVDNIFEKFMFMQYRIYPSTLVSVSSTSILHPITINTSELQIFNPIQHEC